MKILVGSTNKGKINGARDAFLNYFNNIQIEGVNTQSNVPDEPVNDQIYEGAKNRVNNLIEYAKENNIKVNYYVGIEAGIINLFNNYFIMHVAVIKDEKGYESIGISSSFPVPSKYVSKIIKEDLGSVMHSIADINKETGSIAFLTHDIINRENLVKEAVIMALTKHINDIWRDDK